MIRRRLVIALGVALLIHAPAEPAAAHPVPFSYFDLRLHPGVLEGSLVVHILDVAHDLNLPAADRLLDPAFAAQQADAIAKLLQGRLAVRSGGAELMPHWTGLEVLPDRQSVRVRLRFPMAEPAAAVTIDAHLIPITRRS